MEKIPTNKIEVDPELEAVKNHSEIQIEKTEELNQEEKELADLERELAEAKEGDEKESLEQPSPNIESENKTINTTEKIPAPEMDTKLVAEKISEQIKALEKESGTPLTPEQKQQLGQEIFLKSKEEHNKEIAKNAGGFEKFLNKGREYWKELDNSRLGKLSKVAVGSAVIGGTALIGSALIGTIPTGEISRRMFNRIVVSTGLNAMMTSKLTRKGLDALGMDQAGEKFKKYAKIVGVGGGLAASLLLGGPLAAAVGLSGFLAKEGLNKYFDEKIKKINNSIQNFKIESKNFDDGFDINKLAEEMNVFEKERSKMEKTLKRLSWGKNVLNNGLTIGVSMATIKAFDTSPDENKVEDTTSSEKSLEQDSPSKKGFAEAIGKAHDAMKESENFEVVEKGQGVTQVLKEINEKGNAPEWFHKMLGENPKAIDFAHFAESIGVYNPDDIKDSLVITENDKIGFDNAGNLIMERGGVEYILAKADDMGGFTEGDWQEKMQGERFMDTDQKHLDEKVVESKTPTHMLPDDNSPEYTEDPKPYFEDANTNTQDNQDNIEDRDPKGLFKNENIDSKLGDNNGIEINGGYPTEGSYDPENRYWNTNTEDNTNTTETELSNSELNKIERVYEKNIDKMFPDNHKHHEWDNLQNVSAEKIMSLKTGVVYQPIIEHFRDLKEITGLDPIGESISHKAETVPEYMERAYQEAYRLGKLDEIKINKEDLKTITTNTEITETPNTEKSKYDDVYYDPDKFK